MPMPQSYPNPNINPNLNPKELTWGRVDCHPYVAHARKIDITGSG